MRKQQGIRTYFATWSIAPVVALMFAAIVAVGGAQSPAPHTRTGAQTGPSAKEIEQKVDQLLATMSLDEKLGVLGGVDGFFVPGLPSIGLPRLKTSDGPAGTRNDGPATTMAGGIGLAATWNEALAQEVGSEIGRDARARGVHFLLGPGLNIYVAPMNGRNFEYFGEDPYLASRMAVGYVRGVQSHGASATVKHFVANNSEFARHEVDAVIDPRALHEIYMPAFEAAVREAHVGAIMTSYNLVNGAHMSQQGAIVNDIVKKAWGFDGLVMSDWGGTYDGVGAANGGQDLEMPGPQFMNPGVLKAALKDGRVTQATIDDKVRRLLRTAVRFGWLDREQLDPSIPIYNQAGRRTALQAAREGIVLLKNDSGVLPLKTDVKTVAVIGPVAHPTPPVGGGSGETAPFATVSILKGLSDALAGQAAVTSHRGLPSLAQLAVGTEIFTAATAGGPGWTVETFDNHELSCAPASSRVERRVNHKPAFVIADLPELDMGEIFGTLMAGAARPYSARWTGYYRVPEPGTYEVFLHASGESGGTRLTIDDRVVFDNWDVRKAILSQVAIPLAAGAHKIVIEEHKPSGRTDFFGRWLRLGIVRQDTLVASAATDLARRANVVIVPVGWDSSTETEAGDRTFALPVGQEQLIREIAAANPNTVVVAISGGAVDATAWIDRVRGLVAAWYPGQEGGTALAEILTGAVTPSGRLPISWDRDWASNPSKDSYYPDRGTQRVVYRNGVFVGYRGYERDKTEPLFPFGFGLSYTTFRYTNLTIKPVGNDPARPEFDVSFSVTNSGRMAGATVAQVYVADLESQVPRPPKELKGIARVTLKPGETRTVTVRLGPRAFSYFDADSGSWRADPGEFGIIVGQSSAQADVRGTVTLGSS